MNWNQLQYVLTIVQEKNITKAAQKLYLSQPSLSMSLKNLEEELGVEIFERKKESLNLLMPASFSVTGQKILYVLSRFYPISFQTFHPMQDIRSVLASVLIEA